MVKFFSDYLEMGKHELSHYGSEVTIYKSLISAHQFTSAAVLILRCRAARSPVSLREVVFVENVPKDCKRTTQ